MFRAGPWSESPQAGDRIILAGTTPAEGFSGDGGPATVALIHAQGQASGLVIDGEGDLFFVDNANRRVRAIRFGAVLAPPGVTIQATGNGATVRATVSNANGTPSPSVRVDFTVPSSGASCTLSSPFAVTDANGVATVTCTPNCIGGTYSVTTRPLTAVSFATVSFTNVSGPCRRRSIHH